MGKLNTVPPNPFPPSSDNAGGGGALPVASADTLGGVKVGNNLSIDESGVLSAPAPYELPTASADTLGGVKVGDGLSIDAGVLSADSQKVDFSTTEVDTGVKWIDGKAIYLRVLNTSIAINQNDTWYNSGLTGVDTVVNYFPRMTRDGEQIGGTFNGGNLDYAVRNNELLVKGVGLTIADTYVIATQTIFYTKATT